jgi:hypothetical protein
MPHKIKGVKVNKQVNPHALFIVIKPVEEHGWQAKWKEFAGNTTRTRKDVENTNIIEECMWSIDLSTGLHHLSNLVNAAVSSGLPYRVLMLEDAPNWINP